MYRKVLVALTAAALVRPQSASAQVESRSFRISPDRALAFAFGDGDENRAVIGITTSSGSARDTLGVLVSSVTPGGPAERAGIEEGSRIASINGVNLKLSPADVGDWDMASIMSRRLTRELGKVKPGDEVELRFYATGQTRSVKIETASSDILYRTMRDSWFDDEDRAALGVSLGSSGSRRDTLGILISWLDDNGPAAKAGLEEGNRIAAINNVDLRVGRDDAGDEMISDVKVQRLQRELEKVKPGDEVTLRVYAEGRTRDVKVKTVAASTLRRDRNAFIRMPRVRVAPTPMPPRVPMPPMEGARFRMTRITV
jgi:S1-C subfamily serine protease